MVEPLDGSDALSSRAPNISDFSLRESAPRGAGAIAGVHLHRALLGAD